ncbi:MAG: glutamine--tRNA ligase/YqeY domain fusion protein [Burkholderiales bacterium]|nr:glutamine--tRNA ligase/YqeY domain fusion protein [Burkholderiales bacterium]
MSKVNQTGGAVKPVAAESNASHFLKTIVSTDLASPEYASRQWSGAPGVCASHQQPDPARIRTRFPPEPNGYLHVGHAKSICLNFGLASEFGGICHMRFDDTNPEKESQEFADSIVDAVQWLGFSWDANNTSHLFYASNYFDTMYACAEFLIQAGYAYIDQQTAEEMRLNRGTLTEAGKNSPWRDRPVSENLRLFREMRGGQHAEGSMILRAKIDMQSPNINLRDPAIYRIRFAHHHRTGDAWCVYPMYTFAHPIEDALEKITHSICTLEFEDQRPFYDWLLQRLSETCAAVDGNTIGGFFCAPLPKQVEFARLNLTYVVTSKRKLQQLVTEGQVSGWDDPRMPTIAGLRRRGYTPEAIRLFCERIGVSKSDSWIDYSTLEGALRDDLDPKADRGIAVLRPLKLILDNVPADWSDDCSAPVHPHHPEKGVRKFPIHRELWIEADDFMQDPSKGFFRLFPGNKVRLRYGYVVECKGCDLDAAGNVLAVHAEVFLDSKSGTPGADTYKVKGNIHWVSAQAAVAAEVRLYDRLFSEANPDAGGRNFLECLNPASVEVISAMLEPGLGSVEPDARFQFERHGYFVADRRDHGVGRPIFNRITTLKDSWGKAG